MKNIQFLVDAAILHELGERLIGRPAIALGELVKNSFDADAAICQIQFARDEIVISDNGMGMSQDDFLHYWMRIGTTHKIDQGTSKLLGRPLTGSKGIGRLSAQFLADEMILESTSANDDRRSIYAIVDWRNAVRGKDLSKVDVAWEMRRETVRYPDDSPSGTRITLKTLKNEWDEAAIRDLGNDVWLLRSPFNRPPEDDKGRSKDIKTRTPENFDIELDAPEIANAREVFDETMRKVFSNWKARIRGRLNHGRSKGIASVSVDFRRGYPDDSEEPRHFRANVRLPIRSNESETEALVDQVMFEILIFKAVGRQPGGISVGDLREYLAKFGNVSVYDAGLDFRIMGLVETQRVRIGSLSQLIKVAGLMSPSYCPSVSVRKTSTCRTFRHRGEYSAQLKSTPIMNVRLLINQGARLMRGSKSSLAEIG
jgi:hypothetical protein